MEQVLNQSAPGSLAYKSALEELENEPEIPACLEHVWQWFWFLHSTRSSGMNGPLPISYLEINSWQETTHTPIRPFEVNIIKQLDATYLSYNHKEQKKKRENKGKK